MCKRVAVANWISLHRKLSLPCFPEAEAGPAAILGNFPHWLSDVPSHARAIENGEGRGGLGARKGVRQRVVVLSPMVPGIVELASTVDWRLWEGGSFPAIDADVVLVLRPLDILPRMKLDDAPAWLIREAFGSGAVYRVRDLWRMIERHQKIRGDRRQRR